MTKREYINPEIEEVVLDNEISLQLASVPYIGPGEGLGGGEVLPGANTTSSRVQMEDMNREANNEGLVAW